MIGFESELRQTRRTFSGALIHKTKVREETSFDEKPHTGYTTRVTVTMEDGSKLQQLVELPKGGADHPLSNQEIADKFENLCASVMEEGRSDQIRDLVLDMRRLIGLLAGPVKNALA